MITHYADCTGHMVELPAIHGGIDIIAFDGVIVLWHDKHGVYHVRYGLSNKIVGKSLRNGFLEFSGCVRHYMGEYNDE